MIQVSITKDSVLTNLGMFKTQEEADAWYTDQRINFPEGHTREDSEYEEPVSPEVTARTSAIAKLTKLGLSADEITALLG